MPADTLTEILTTATHAHGPRLTWYSPGERIELTGHVLGMWLAKTAGMVTAEAGADVPTGSGQCVVHLGLPAHWRTLTWAAGSWLAGACVRVGTPDATAEPATLSVATSPQLLDDDAEVQVLVPLASLAQRWPGDLPPLALDGAADLMGYPDAYTPPPLVGWLPALETTGHAYAAGFEAAPAPGPVSGAASSAAPGVGPGRTPGAGPSRRPGPTEISRYQLVADLPDLTGSRAPVLVHTSDVPTAFVTVLAAWRAERPAVLLAPEADDALAATAARQEGALVG